MPFKKKIRKTARSAGKAVEDSEESAGVRAGVRAGVKRKTTATAVRKPNVQRVGVVKSLVMSLKPPPPLPPLCFQSPADQRKFW